MATFAERSANALANTKEREKDDIQIQFKRDETKLAAAKFNKTMFYLDIKLAEDEKTLIELFTTTAKEQKDGDIKLKKETVQNYALNTKNKVGKKIWTKKVIKAYGKLLAAIDPYTTNIHKLPGMTEGVYDEPLKGGKKHRKKRTRKKKKSRKRRRIGNNKKKLKRLQTQYRRFRIAKGDKRFKGTDGLIKWSRPSKSKKKGKKRSRRIYHRKRKKKNRKKRGGRTHCKNDAWCYPPRGDLDRNLWECSVDYSDDDHDEQRWGTCQRRDQGYAGLRQRAHHPDDSDDE